MHEKLLSYKAKIAEKWGNIDKSLRKKIVIIAIGLIVILGLLLYISFKPQWIVLKSNADPETIGRIEQILNDNQVKNKLLDRGTGIEVLEKDESRAKILIASSDIGKEGLTFDDVSANIDIGMTENDKKQQYQRLKEAEMEQLIESFENVKEASVKLALPEDTVIFNNNKKEASAGVTLNVDNTFTEEQGITIANLIASSVEGVKIENVTIADTKGKMLYSGKESNGISHSKKEEIEKNKTVEIETKIQDALKPLYDEVKVISSVKFDWDKVQERNLVLTPPVADATVGVPKKQKEQTESVVNGQVGAEPGIESNDKTPTNYAMGGNNTGTYDGANKETEYGYNENEQLKEISGGSFVPEESSVAVTVYKYKYYNEADLIKNKTINKDLSWEQFKEQNNKPILIAMDQELLDTIKTGTGIDSVTLTGYEKQIFIDKVKQPIKVEQIIVLIILVILIALLALGLIKKAQPDEIEEIEPEISIEDLIATNKREDEEVAEQLAGINEVESEFKLKIEDFIDENPEAAAQLLRNWLNDEWE
ncbi:hypothetical protein [uncultured Tyzzerella sp.]|uniref:hypothetical protein n=1 Tax=uncultured Tyzzerella sp. TaxID=2321398 RepID=UPI0029420EAB|nr:hypothetical protein [uncultured Tyzzerella sp.]